MVNLSKEDRLRNILQGRRKVRLSDVHDTFLDRYPHYSVSKVQLKSILNNMGYRVTEWGADVYIKR